MLSGQVDFVIKVDAHPDNGVIARAEVVRAMSPTISN